MEMPFLRGDDDFMVEEARKMYHKISPETGEFIDFMIEHELMDLKNKPGKAATGYMDISSGLSGTVCVLQFLIRQSLTCGG